LWTPQGQKLGVSRHRGHHAYDEYEQYICRSTAPSGGPEGATEIAGVENAIRAKLQGWKMQEWKMRE